MERLTVSLSPAPGAVWKGQLRSLSIRSRYWRLPLVLGLALTLASVTAPAAEPEQARAVNLELLLAVDASSSISGEEFDLQIRGLAEAFRHPSVARAIRASGELGLAVALFQWSSHHQQFVAIDWTLVKDASTASRFAKEIDSVVRSTAGNTAIGSALIFAIDPFRDDGLDGLRKVIDVSGDGPNNHGSAVGFARDLALARGITINGLAILNEEPALRHYYASNVIGGSGAFVMTANDYEAYSAAILAKLIKEIAGPPIAAYPNGAEASLAAAPR